MAQKAGLKKRRRETAKAAGEAARKTTGKVGGKGGREGDTKSGTEKSGGKSRRFFALKIAILPGKGFLQTFL